MIYYSNNCGKVVSTYLDLIQIENGDAESIVSALGHFYHIIHFTYKIWLELVKRCMCNGWDT